MNLLDVALGDIITDGPQAGRFSFAFEPEVNSLAESIKLAGLINPPRLRRAGEKLEVVCGLRRVRACLHLGFQKISALVHESDELTDEHCLRLSLIDSEWSGRLSPVEQAIALQKFSALGYQLDKLVSEVAPYLKLPQSRNYSENHLRLLSLEPEILRAVHRRDFGIEQAFLLFPIVSESRLPLFNLIQCCKANLNETRELISLVMDVAAMRGVSVAALIPLLAAEELESPREKFQAVRESLLGERHPARITAESQFNTIAGELGLGDKCRIDAPRYFEGNDITLTIRASNADQFNEAIRKLSQQDMIETFHRLFSILQQKR